MITIAKSISNAIVQSVLITIATLKISIFILDNIGGTQWIT